jgi:energy-coupling factor transport system permease protein
LLLALWLTILSVAIWPAYIHQGGYLGRVWFVDVTTTGILYGIAMGLRVSIMILAAAIWMMSTSPQRLTAGLMALGLPYRPGLALSAAIRFVPFMNAERLTFMEAQRARCAQIGSGGPIRRVAHAAPVLVPLFSRAFLTAQSLSIAMDARGLGAGRTRTSLHELRYSRADRIALAAAGFAAVAAIVLRVLGYGVLVKGFF